MSAALAEHPRRLAIREWFAECDREARRRQQLRADFSERYGLLIDTMPHWVCPRWLRGGRCRGWGRGCECDRNGAAGLVTALDHPRQARHIATRTRIALIATYDTTPRGLTPLRCWLQTHHLAAEVLEGNYYSEQTIALAITAANDHGRPAILLESGTP